MNQEFVPDLSIVMPAYDANGRLHESVYALKEHLVNRGRRAEVLVVAACRTPGLPWKRIRVEEGVVVETTETPAGRPGPSPLAGAILATLADRIVLVDAPPLYPVAEMETLLARLDEGCDVVVARPLDGAASDERRGLCFAAYRGSVARQVAAMHGAQDFGCGDEHLFLLADPDLRVCEQPLGLRTGAKGTPCSFGGALRQFRDARRDGSFGPLVPAPDVA